MRLWGQAFGRFSRNLVPFITIFLPHRSLNPSLAKYASSIFAKISNNKGYLWLVKLEIYFSSNARSSIVPCARFCLLLCAWCIQTWELIYVSSFRSRMGGLVPVRDICDTNYKWGYSDNSRHIRTSTGRSPFWRYIPWRGNAHSQACHASTER